MLKHLKLSALGPVPVGEVTRVYVTVWHLLETENVCFLLETRQNLNMFDFWLQ